MDFITGLISQAWDAIKPQHPTAYTRITRTPVVMQPQQGDAAGYYRDGRMYMDPRYLLGPQSAIPHESAHQIYQEAGLGKQAGAMLPDVPPGLITILKNSPLYRNVGDAGSAEQLTDEGLAYSTGSLLPDKAAFVQAAAQRIQDPQLRQQLLRLDTNRRAVKQRGFTP